jgi:non-lysosomal glucosylceramidase
MVFRLTLDLADPANGNIDNGYWQGAPVGGLGAGTFSRSYRGNFERWHVKAGVHKYQNVPANQFAVFAQPEGGKPVAQVLSTGKPEGGALSAWSWTYPVGGGEYAAVDCRRLASKRSPPSRVARAKGWRAR